MYRVQILWHGDWCTLPRPYASRGDAEWAIAVWRTQNGGNGKDTGFRVIQVEEAG